MFIVPVYAVLCYRAVKHGSCLEQWSSRCTLVNTTVHESYFIVQETYGLHETKFETYTRYYQVAQIQKKVVGVFINNFKTYTRYFCVADDKQKKIHRCFLENLSVDIMRKLYIGVHSFFCSIV